MQITIWGITITLSEDWLTLKVEDGAPWGISQTEMEVGLQAAPAVTWHKEVVAWNDCTGAHLAAFTSDLNSGPHYFRIGTGSDCTIGPTPLSFAR
jgi:hypothetical protein